jgi:hypothetical protein
MDASRRRAYDALGLQELALAERASHLELLLRILEHFSQRLQPLTALGLSGWFVQ